MTVVYKASCIGLFDGSVMWEVFFEDLFFFIF